MIELDDGEQFVEETTTTKRVGRQKAAKAVETEPPPPVDLYDDDDFEVVEPPYPDGTAAHKLWLRSQSLDAEDDSTNFDQGDVLVVRKPDGPTEKFLTPCISRVSCAPLRNVDLANLSESDIEESVRTLYGGGHYYLQYKIGKTFLTGWGCDLADSPDAVAAARAAAAPQPVAPATAPAPVHDPLEYERQRNERLRLEREYDELKHGDERRRMERLETEIAELRKAPPAEPQSDLALAVQLLRGNNDPTIVDFVRDVVVPGERESPTSVWDFAKYVMENAGTVLPVIASALGLAPPPQSPQQAVTDLMRSAPPSTPAQPPTAGTFRRQRQAPPPDDPPLIEGKVDAPQPDLPPDASDADATDAEIIEETAND